MINWISLYYLFHRARICSRAFLVGPLRMLIKSLKCLDVILLARGRVQVLGLFELFATALQHRQLRTVPELVPQAHGNSPMRYRALRVVLLDLLKFLLGFFIPKRVQHGHAAFHWFLHGSRAGGRKVDGPELSFSQVFVMVAFVVSCEMTRHNKREGKKQDSFHGRTTGIRVYLPGCR